jgi:hypothetical protein
MHHFRNGFPSAALVEYFACAYARALAPGEVREDGREGSPWRAFDRQKARELRQQGLSYPRIARSLGVGQGTS